MRSKHRKGKGIIHWQRAKWMGKKRLPMGEGKVKLAPWSWGFGLGSEWVDIPFQCRACHKSDTWTAEQQKTYYELWGNVYREQRPIRCRACRLARRAALTEQRRRSEAGRLAKLAQTSTRS